MKDLEMWEFLLRQLEHVGRAGLMVVVRSEGSSPGRKGFKMAVALDGSMTGSIGGGIMEHKLVEYVKDKLASNEAFWELREQIHSKDAPRDQSGMICSGTQWIAIVCLDSDELYAVRAIVAGLKRGTIMRMLLDQSGLEAAPLASALTGAHSEISDEFLWSYLEALGRRDVVHVIGGGHVGKAMCRVLSLLDFYVVNYDDRPDLNTMEANRHANEKIVVPYPQLADLIQGGPDVYVIVMTFGYRGDDQAIRALIGKEFAYLGMMGSETKVNHLFRRLKKDGYPKEQIARIHSPAGLTIHCTTPMEIAVSVAAEIIDVKNNRNPNPFTQ